METGIALITSLQNNSQNMLAQTEGQAKTDGIYALGPLQYQVTAPNDRPEVVLDNLGKHTVWGSQGTNPDGSGTHFTLRDGLKEFFEIMQRRSQDYLIIRAGTLLEYRYPNDLAHNLRINPNDMTIHRRL
jgi:hypothetical protein